MIFGQDRRELRKMYASAWQKRQENVPLTRLEAQIAGVIECHPEYHDVVADGSLETDYLPGGGQTNPFLHMGLHLGIREQVATDRPAGISQIHATLSEKSGNSHDVEHQMIECLAETLWEAQSLNRAPDERAYLEQLRQLVR